MIGGDDDTGTVRRVGWSARAASFVQAAGRAIRDVVVPPVCLSCHAPLTRNDTLCTACWVQVSFIRAPMCDRLGIPLPFDTGGVMVSAMAVANPPEFQRARAVAEFTGTIQKLVHGFKYSDRHDARRLFGRWLTSAGEPLLADCDVLVPVPLHRWKLLQRRYNQSAILANELSRLTGVAAAPLALVRLKATQSQVGLSTEERLLNVKNAFAVPDRERASIAGRHVVLVDDVITTGATCNAAARALKAAGARQVDVLALAVVSHTVG